MAHQSRDPSLLPFLPCLAVLVDVSYLFGAVVPRFRHLVALASCPRAGPRSQAPPSVRPSEPERVCPARVAFPEPAPLRVSE